MNQPSPIPIEDYIPSARKPSGGSPQPAAEPLFPGARLLFHRMPWGEDRNDQADLLVEREWLVTNGLGGYASGTIAGISTRRYHGLLVAAFPSPLGRMVMLNHVAEEVRLPGGPVSFLSGRARADGGIDRANAAVLREFRQENGLPVWVYSVGPFELEKRLVMPHLQNTVHVSYRVLAGNGSVRLRIRPSFHFRSHEASVGCPSLAAYPVSVLPQGLEIHDNQVPPLRMRLTAEGGAVVMDGGRFRDVFYRVEQSRGYDARGCLWSPGYFRVDLAPGAEAVVTASTESWETVLALAPCDALVAERQRRERLLAQTPVATQDDFAGQLVVAADQFIVTPTARVADAARAHASGDEVRTVIAGYHWFTDWGRDTMISLEGLTLLTGRQTEAGYILRGFARHVRNGLIPNLFPEGEREGLYHTADATLWYFHAIDRYLEATGDRGTLRRLLPILHDIARHHLEGTQFGIRVDPADGLLTQGQTGYQLTWMDAKVGDWVVTPRRGKAVEINALWYNTLRLLESWVRAEEGDEAAEPYGQAAQRVYRSFNERFWYPGGEYLYDVVDGEHGNDPSMRPNQIFAISLPHPVLDRPRWHTVLDKVIRRLLTPMGLRSLAPGEPDYKPRYDGDLRSRDAAYHQGTVWAWLIGPLVDAWMKVHPEDVKAARDFLVGFQAHLAEACLGQISEVFDAEAPYTPRGCVAQAWSVAEVLRAWVKTHRDEGPKAE